MNYQKHYNLLVSRGKNRTLLEGTYAENHHILPRCMGGSDDCLNLVRLTAEEHYVAHQLLAKIYPEVPGLVYACVIMSAGEKRTNNKLYGWIRRRCAEAMRDRVVSDETKQKMSLAARNKPLVTKETKQKMREAQLSRPPRKLVTEETKQKMSEAHLGVKVHTAESKEKIRKARLGKKHSKVSVEKMKISQQKRPPPPPVTEETRAKISKANTGRPCKETTKTKISNTLQNKLKNACPHCGLAVAANTMKRWHGDKCKKKL